MKAAPSRVVLAREQPFLIGSVEVRPATREISFAGQTSIIEPRVLQVLVALCRATGGVVSKEDLAELCWEGRIVGEDAINRVVSRLRSVAEKQAGSQFRIETITKVGYRLIVPSGVLEPRASASAPPSASGGPLPHNRLDRRTLVAAGAAAVAGLGALGWKLRRHDSLPAEARTLVDSAQKPMFEGTVEETSDAIGALRRAAQIAPGSALVWGQLAYAYMRQSLQAPSDQRAELRTRANAAIQRAFVIQRGQPDALAAQITGLRVFRNWLAVDRACRSALGSYPDNLGLLSASMNVLMQTGRTRDALEQIQRAQVLAPTIAHFSTSLGIALWDLGRFEEADAAFERSATLWPRVYRIWFTKANYLMYEGRAAQALAMIDDAANRPVGIPTWNFDLVRSQASAIASKDAAAIRRAVQMSADYARKGTGFAENAAVFAAFVGDFDTANAMLSALYFNRGFSLPDAYFTPEQGIYSGLDRHTYILFRRPMHIFRRDARFALLTRELGLDDYWRRTGSRAQVGA